MIIITIIITIEDYEAFLETGDASFRWPDLPETALHAVCYTSGRHMGIVESLNSQLNTPLARDFFLII